LSAGSALDGGAQCGNPGVHGAAQQNEHRGHGHGDQPTGNGVFHNGQAVFIFGELQYRSLDSLKSHFAHLIGVVFKEAVHCELPDATLVRRPVLSLGGFCTSLGFFCASREIVQADNSPVFLDRRYGAFRDPALKDERLMKINSAN
jgi:hypothetical protein